MHLTQLYLSSQNVLHAGQEREATREQKRDMYKQLSVLQMLVRHYVQRFGDEILTRELPPKREHILLLRLSPLQRRLYAVFMRHLVSCLLPLAMQHSHSQGHVQQPL